MPPLKTIGTYKIKAMVGHYHNRALSLITVFKQVAYLKCCNDNFFISSNKIPISMNIIPFMFDTKEE